MLPIDPRTAVEILLKGLPKRTATMLEKRFGLSKGGKQFTLEAIGDQYGITRERVRQIERDGIMRIKKAAGYKDMEPLFLLFRQFIDQRGGVAAESMLMSHFAPDEAARNYIRFLLTLAPGIFDHREDAYFHARWGTNQERLEAVDQALRDAFTAIQNTDRVHTEDEALDTLSRSMADRAVTVAERELLPSVLGLTKCISVNCFGQWGHVDSPLIRPRGVRDMAYLVFKKEARPLHFLETAKLIKEYISDKNVHVQTVHNELIKDNRFVLVGRGTYGLAEWGYEPGTVRDIITRVLGSAPLLKEDIVGKVLERRQVKPNTVVINLQDRRFFKKLPDGRYTTAV